MSNCCANSASAFSPLTAANATFALNAGVWFRRGRLVMVSPVRHPYWPLSGRNSTYPDVQISRASSLQRRRILGEDHGVDIKLEGHTGVTEFPDAIERLQSSRHAYLEDVLAEGPDVGD